MGRDWDRGTGGPGEEVEEGIESGREGWKRKGRENEAGTSGQKGGRDVWQTKTLIGRGEREN